MGKQYSHLSPEERAVLQVERDRGTSLRAIGRRFGRSASTLSREIGRQQSSRYSAHSAAVSYRARRVRSVRPRLLAQGTAMFAFVHDRLVFDRWSGQQIAATLRVMHPDDARQRVSHETIYAAIYAHPRGGLKQALVQALRQGKPTRGLRRTTAANARGCRSSSASCIAQSTWSNAWFPNIGRAI